MHHLPGLPGQFPLIPTNNMITSAPSTEPLFTLPNNAIFSLTKLTLAKTFLTDLDNTLTNGKIAKITKSTGGVKIIWNARYRVTAGLADTNYDPQLDRDGGKQKIWAEIQLSDKLIIDEERLFTVMAHEFCHLADFLISKTEGRPHGRSFWGWARKCNDAFKKRGIRITRDYEFAEGFQYIWMCSNPVCGVEIGRYSKSFDVEKVVCGECGSKLVQTHPAPQMLRHGSD